MNVEQYKELRARFKKHFPDALFFVNNPNDEDLNYLATYENGDIIVNPLESDNVIGDILPICGCGYSEEVAWFFYRTMEWCYDNKHDERRLMFDEWIPGWDTGTNNPARLLQCVLLYWLDCLGYTEHGGSVFGSWLTEKGRCARDVLGVATRIYKPRGIAT